MFVIKHLEFGYIVQNGSTHDTRLLGECNFLKFERIHQATKFYKKAKMKSSEFKILKLENVKNGEYEMNLKAA